MKRHAVWSSLFVVILTILIDQGVKHLVETRMGYGQQIDLLPFLALFRTHNEGIAFSMLAWLHDWGLVAITAAVILFVLYLWWTNAPDRIFARYGFALVVGGYRQSDRPGDARLCRGLYSVPPADMVIRRVQSRRHVHNHRRWAHHSGRISRLASRAGRPLTRQLDRFQPFA